MGHSWKSVVLPAAVAIAVGGALTYRQVSAESSAASLTSIVPCRLLDTRTGADHIGQAISKLGPDTVATVAVTGQHGNCTVPVGATAVSTNITVVNPTAASYLTVYPSGMNRPTASNLNWIAGQAPTSNQAVVALGGAGIDVFNLTGAVDLIIDVNGYYTPSSGGSGTQGPPGPPGPPGPAGSAEKTLKATWPDWQPTVANQLQEIADPRWNDFFIVAATFNVTILSNTTASGKCQVWDGITLLQETSWGISVAGTPVIASTTLVLPFSWSDIAAIHLTALCSSSVLGVVFQNPTFISTSLPK